VTKRQPKITQLQIHAPLYHLSMQSTQDLPSSGRRMNQRIAKTSHKNTNVMLILSYHFPVQDHCSKSAPVGEGVAASSAHVLCRERCPIHPRALGLYRWGRTSPQMVIVILDVPRSRVPQLVSAISGHDRVEMLLIDELVE
jgi:hypothetical protein